MTSHETDAQLVTAHLAGDPGALAGIYDRYADSLHDTAAAMLGDRHDAADVLQDVVLIAAERLGQLRDPERLKPWLFAILRNEVYRRSKKHRRTIATDFSGSDDGHDMADDRHTDLGDDVAETAAGDDLAALVHDAARGLDERDQLVLELSVRQGLEGQDLADALGVSANQSYTLVHRMRERVERSLGAFVVARAGRKDCTDLDKILGSWDGEFTVLIRKRVARHIDRCDVCADSRRKVAPLALVAGAPVLAAPTALRDQILGTVAGRAAPTTPYAFTAEGGFPAGVRAARRAAWVAPMAAASLILVASTLAFLWIDRDSSSDSVRGAVAERPADDETTVSPGRDGPEESTSATDTPAATADAASAGDVQAVTTDAPNSTGAAATSVPMTTTTAASTATTSVPAPSPSTTQPATVTQSTSATPPPAPPPPPTAAPTTPAPSPVTTTPLTTTTTTTVAPGAITLSGGLIDLGSSASSGSVSVTNTGGQPVSFTVTGSPGAFGLAPTAGELAGRQSRPITATIDRGSLKEGEAQSTTVRVSGGGQTFLLTLRAIVERAPETKPIIRPACRSIDVAFDATASIVDESGVANATLTMAGPAETASSRLESSESNWSGVVAIMYPGGPNDPDSANGTWTWTISATDTRGNTGSTSGSLAVTCP